MQSHLEGLQLPSGLRVDESTLSSTFGEFTAEPLEKGYGVIIGNSLRRVLLLSLQGGAIRRVRVQGVAHEFAAIPGVREDAVELVLNLKGVVLKIHDPSQDTVLSLVRTESGPVTAGDIEPHDNVEVVNRDHYICTIDTNGSLGLELEVGVGRGFVPFSGNKHAGMDIGVIPIDSIYSPVRKANFRVENTRVNQDTEFERLVLEVHTNGTISPVDAVNAAAGILHHHYSLLVTSGVPAPAASLDSGILGSNIEILARRVSEIFKDSDIHNPLLAAKIETVGQLVEKSLEEIGKIKQIGKQRLEKIQEGLLKLGLGLKQS